MRPACVRFGGDALIKSDRPRRVALLCGRVRQGFSGTEDFARRLTEELAPDFLTEWVDLPSWRLRMTPRLYRAVAQMAPDVILAQYPTDAFRFGLAPHAFALLNRIAPIALTLHEFSMGHRLRKLSIVALSLRCSAVIVTTEMERATLLSRYPWLKPRMRIIPIASNLPARDWAPGGQFTIGFFGQIRPRKGIETFIEAAGLARAGGRDWRFRLYGSVLDQHRSYLEGLRSRLERENVRIVLSASDVEIADGLSSAHAVLLDYPDGATMRRGSLLAAAACGTPIVTRHSEETPELIVRNTAHAENSAQAIDRLVKVAEDERYRYRLHKGALAIHLRTGWAEVIDAYRTTLNQLATTKSR